MLLNVYFLRLRVYYITKFILLKMNINIFTKLHEAVTKVHEEFDLFLRVTSCFLRGSS
jgi:hypothetical protein